MTQTDKYIPPQLSSVLVASMTEKDMRPCDGCGRWYKSDELKLGRLNDQPGHYCQECREVKR